MARRRRRMETQRTGWWWAVYVTACAAMAIFIAFDVLDLDGSDLTTGLPGSAVTADARGPELDRFLAIGTDLPISWGGQRTPVVSPSLLASAPSLRIRMRRTGTGTARAPVHADGGRRSLSSEPSDPF